MTWIGKARRRETNHMAALFCSMRYFGGQHRTYIAKAAGMTEGELRSFLSRLNLPRDLDRKKFGPSFDLECAKATLESSGYKLERSRTPNLDSSMWPFFWKLRSDRGVTTNRAARFSSGALGEYDKYKGQTITLVTRQDLNSPNFDFDCDAPLNGPWFPPPARPQSSALRSSPRLC